MSAYLVAAYLVVLGGLAAYALRLRFRLRSLEHEARGSPGADTLGSTEDA